MNNLAKLSLVSVLLLGTAYGAAQAQQANTNPPPASDKQMADCRQDNQDDDCDGRGWGGRHGGEHGRGHGGKGGPMKMIDVNGDGVIGADEAAALADGAFMRIDDNRDGMITEAEFIAGPHGKRGWFNWNSDEQAAVEKLRKDKFASLDTDKNAGLSKVEFFADAQTQLAAADTDKDGKVTPWEFRAAVPMRR